MTTTFIFSALLGNELFAEKLNIYCPSHDIPREESKEKRRNLGFELPTFSCHGMALKWFWVFSFKHNIVKGSIKPGFEGYLANNNGSMIFLHTNFW